MDSKGGGMATAQKVHATLRKAGLRKAKGAASGRIAGLYTIYQAGYESTPTGRILVSWAGRTMDLHDDRAERDATLDAAILALSAAGLSIDEDSHDGFWVS